jgi:predicted N-formylglutamate amidohydrolase
MTAFELPPQGYRYVGQPGRATGRYIFTCEHASNTVSSRLIQDSDRRLLSQHWGWDIGAASLVETLCQQTEAIGVLATESRLVIDFNRHPDSETLIVKSCEGDRISFNQDITPQDHHFRKNIFDSFHAGVRSAITQQVALRECCLVSIHSFTPIWQDVPREVEIGVLFDRYADDAVRVANALKATGVKTGLNEPYSGTSGELMYSATMHGDEHGLPYLEIEVRQDLLGSPQGIAQVAQWLVTALEVF